MPWAFVAENYHCRLLQIIIIIPYEPQPLLVWCGTEIEQFIESLLVTHLWFHSPSLKATSFQTTAEILFHLASQGVNECASAHTKSIQNELCSEHNCCIILVQGFQLTPFCFPVMQSEVHSFQIADPDCLSEVLHPLLTHPLPTENWVAEISPHAP